MTVKPETKFNLRVVLSGKCNYKCTFCSLDFNQGAPNRDMCTDLLNGCIEAFARLGGERVHFSGGEPLLYPQLNDALRLVQSLGMSNALTTNGALLEAQGPEFPTLVDKINVSMPAFEQGAYAAVTRSKGVLLERVKAEAVAMRRRGICVKINAVYLEDNEETLSEMVAFFSAQDITTKIMNDMFGSREYYEKLLAYAERWRNHPYVVIEKELNPGLPICRDCRVSKRGSCPSCRSIWLYPDGWVTVCPRGQEGGFRCSTLEDAQRAIEMCWRMA